MNYTVYGILQARILEGIAIHFSKVSSQLRDQTQVSYIAGGFFTTFTSPSPEPPGKLISTQIEHKLCGQSHPLLPAEFTVTR